MNSLPLSFVLGVGISLMCMAKPAPDEWKVQYEPETPILAGWVTEEGLQGRVADLERITAANALTQKQERKWKGSAWRNERVSGQFVVWSGKKLEQLRLSVSSFKSAEGNIIPEAAVRARFVRYVLAKDQLVADVLDTAKTLPLPAGGFRPIWLTITVPESAPAGIYRGELLVTAENKNRLSFPIELTVLSPTLPAPRDWSFVLDLWQHPWAVARYHAVEPFSENHYRLLEPIYRELAQAGQKTITTTLTDLPWNHQNFDPYFTMIEHLRQPDGTWKNDYTLFDEYVAFCQKCGLGPQIHCYTMATWGNRVYYRDAVSGDRVAVTLKAGTPEHEAFWGPFLTDFQKHLAKKGWADQTYIALDERSREETRATAACVRKYAPRLKLAMAGNRPPSYFQGLEIDSFCEALRLVDTPFLKEVQQRNAAGKITTFYVSCSIKHPNTFTTNATADPVWMCYYAAAHQFSGFLRWAIVNWARDPLFSSDFGRFPPGDTYFLYPGPRSSIRWERLRDGIEENEKIKWLRKKGADLRALDQILSRYDIKKTMKEDDAYLIRQTEETRQAVEAASRQIR